MRTAGQVERLLWAAAEARRLRVKPDATVARPRGGAGVLTMPPELFTTEWQTVWVPEPHRETAASERAAS